ncbi:MAG TPA: hypothetical protein VE619_00710 [Nitrososphaeraceae archaeon]|nr:hypothetical protein [Nitrososphaeraceae archaeon]
MILSNISIPIHKTVTQQPKAESRGEETSGECPTCHGKGELDKQEE